MICMGFMICMISMIHMLSMICTISMINTICSTYDFFGLHGLYTFRVCMSCILHAIETWCGSGENTSQIDGNATNTK